MALDLDCQLSIAEAAMYFRSAGFGQEVSRATINGWYARGRLPGTKIQKGQRRYVLRELLDAERDTRRSPNSSRSLTRRGIDLVSV
jgi:hypothetical protein